VKDCNTILLANHGTVSWGTTVELAYFNTEIIDAYCKILMLAKQLGRVNYFSEKDTSELMQFKKRIGIDDPRLHINDCELCGPSVFADGYGDFIPEPYAFQRDDQEPTAYVDQPAACTCANPATKSQVQVKDMDDLVRIVTEKVMAALAETKA
jgi:L-fuculose-phosphate aldolase